MEKGVNRTEDSSLLSYVFSFFFLSLLYLPLSLYTSHDTLSNVDPNKEHFVFFSSTLLLYSVMPIFLFFFMTTPLY